MIYVINLEKMCPLKQNHIICVVEHYETLQNLIRENLKKIISEQ